MRVKLVALASVLSLGIIFFPGIVSTIKDTFDDEETALLTDPRSRQWVWTRDDLRRSVLEAGCGLPFSNCAERPYHRRALSYILINGLSCVISTAIFYPLYMAGKMLTCFIVAA
ncbi:hypothetical protein AVEN_66709-1 [Araneus ventricosus]|uniref:Uncharacterized protein n=1 Tax=Araneus ventricosus TaxID=182803 RepID=A0A4Y2SNW2_ARAVE|nr:hypothetical protein AVEN_13729-1 [Araneus ventricosus]GBN88766.1 hypothetical protein AVEN_66709-1 [Araneus ventricosus]